jgi:hypothetical protein
MGLCSIIFKEWRVTWTFSYTYTTINKKNKQQNCICIRAFDSRLYLDISSEFKEAIDQYIQDTSEVFQVWHNLCSELTSMRTFKMYSRSTKTTNEPTASNNKLDRPFGIRAFDSRLYLDISRSFK